MTHTDAQIEAAAKAVYTALREWETGGTGQKESVFVARAALAAAEEAGEWEYGTGWNGGVPTMRANSRSVAHYHASQYTHGLGIVYRRRPAGPWLPVEGGEG